MKSRIRKVLLCLLLCFFVLNNESNSVHAFSQIEPNKIEEIKPYAEESKWYYRDVRNGKQKRLWSRTYGYWITDWIWA